MLILKMIARSWIRRKVRTIKSRWSSEVTGYIMDRSISKGGWGPDIL